METLTFQLYTNGTWFHAINATCSLYSESNNYAIRIQGFGGNPGDSLSNTTVASKWYHNGMDFSTWDKDNDEIPKNNIIAPSNIWPVLCVHTWGRGEAKERFAQLNLCSTRNFPAFSSSF